jgi:hypothetical protein
MTWIEPIKIQRNRFGIFTSTTGNKLHSVSHKETKMNEQFRVHRRGDRPKIPWTKMRANSASHTETLSRIRDPSEVITYAYTREGPLLLNFQQKQTKNTWLVFTGCTKRKEIRDTVHQLPPNNRQGSAGKPVPKKIKEYSLTHGSNHKNMWINQQYARLQKNTEATTFSFVFFDHFPIPKITWRGWLKILE